MTTELHDQLAEHIAFLEQEDAKLRRKLGRPQNTGAIRTIKNPNAKPRGPKLYAFERGSIKDGVCSIHGTEFIRFYSSIGSSRCRKCETLYEAARAKARRQGKPPFNVLATRDNDGNTYAKVSTTRPLSVEETAKLVETLAGLIQEGG